MGMTLFSEYLVGSGFFGDKIGSKQIEWGTRHYLYSWMCVSLLFLGLIKIFNTIVGYSKKSEIIEDSSINTDTQQ